MTSPRIGAALVVALALLAAACGTEPEAVPDDTPAAVADEADPPDPVAPTPLREPDPTPTPAAGGARAVPDVLDFTAPGVTGGQVVGADYAGDALALWFWAPW